MAQKKPPPKAPPVPPPPKPVPSRSGYVQKLDNGNWEVVERAGRKLKVLSGKDGFDGSLPDALVAADLGGAVPTKAPEKHVGRERWEWGLASIR